MAESRVRTAVPPPETPSSWRVFVLVKLGGRDGARVRRGLTGVLVFLLVGETVSRTGLADSRYLPPPSVILARAAGLVADPSFLRDIAFTLSGWATGLLIAFVIAVPGGLLLGSLPVVNSAVRMLIEFLRPIPAVALIPLIVLIVADQGQIERILAAYAAVWPIMLNTIYAVGDVDPVARDMARSFGLGRLRILLRIALPSIAPFVATGTRVASSIALVVTISTELVAGGGEHGIGIFMLGASGVADNADVVFAAVAIAGLLGFLLDLIMKSVERRLFRWHFERLGRRS